MTRMVEVELMRETDAILPVACCPHRFLVCYVKEAADTLKGERGFGDHNASKNGANEFEILSLHQIPE